MNRAPPNIKTGILLKKNSQRVNKNVSGGDEGPQSDVNTWMIGTDARLYTE